MPSTDVKEESMFDSKVGSLAIEDIEGLFDWKWFQSLLSFQRFGSILSVKLSVVVEIVFVLAVIVSKTRS